MPLYADGSALMDFTLIVKEFLAYGGPWAALYVIQLYLNAKREMAQAKSTRETVDLLGAAFAAFVERFDDHDTVCRAMERSIALMADKTGRRT